MAEGLARQQSAMKAWLQAEAESRVERPQNRRTRGFFAHDSAGVYGNCEQTQWCMVGSCDSSGSGDGSELRVTRRGSWHSLDRSAGTTFAVCT